MAGFNLVFTKHGEFIEVVPSTTERITAPGHCDNVSRSQIAHVLTSLIPSDWQQRMSELYALELKYRTERLALYRQYQSEFSTNFQPILDNIHTTNPELFI